MHNLKSEHPAEEIADVADQFQKLNKMPYMHWIIPNAKQNRDAGDLAWYTPSKLQVFPGRPELEDDEDEEGMLETVAYIESLIEACERKGIPSERIVLGGFSQGCAMGLLTVLVSQKYSGKLAGIVGLMGYLPLAKDRRLEDMRSEAELPPVVGEVPVFLVRGKKDMLIPSSVWQRGLDKLAELGLNKEAMEVHEYEGVGHSITPQVMQDMCSWLERVLPPLED